MRLSNLMEAWGTAAGLEEQAVLDSVREHMFHEDTCTLRFAIINEASGIAIRVQPRRRPSRSNSPLQERRTPRSTPRSMPQHTPRGTPRGAQRGYGASSAGSYGRPAPGRPGAERYERRAARIAAAAGSSYSRPMKCSCGETFNLNFCPNCGANRPEERVKCTNCGHMIAPSAKFCESCGAEAPLPRRPSAHSPPRSRREQAEVPRNGPYRHRTPPPRAAAAAAASAGASAVRPLTTNDKLDCSLDELIVKDEIMATS